MKPLNLTTINNELYLNNYSLKELAKTYHTPLYVYDENHILSVIDEYLNNFKTSKFETKIVYASKAFLVPEICNIASSKGLMIDAVSIGDLYVIEKSGFPLENVVFHGNNKSNEELEYAVSHKVGLIVVDNLDELNRLNKITNEKKVMVNTLFRVNPGIDAHTHKFIQTALYISKFGESIYDEETIDEIIKKYQASNYVKLLGFHSHIGSQIHDQKPFLMNIDKMVEFTKKIENKYQIKLPYLNLGGGFGIQYQTTDKKLDLENLLKKMIKRLTKKANELEYNLECAFIEPGRSIVGEAGITLYECGTIKHTYGGKNFLFVDGGMTDNIRPALYSALYTVDVVNKINEPKTITVDIAGKCCESGDIIAHNQLIPETTPGDILVVYDTGAYTYSMSSNYNGQLKPAVILIGEKVKLISKKEELNDLYRHFE